MTADPREGPHVRQLLGAYVLDALTAAETGAVTRHLGTCDSCAADYVEVAQAASLLALLDGDELLE
ncbi:zf-HC2 domain-containing protein [Streptomyces sp. NPDC014734]|uniref:zf-HC2 domain-containing protein n=1 Tax=Streptomyces sp. NPDC014734 TaxID=3364886 RepID=UPI00370203D4